MDQKSVPQPEWPSGARWNNNYYSMAMLNKARSIFGVPSSARTGIEICRHLTLQKAPVVSYHTLNQLHTAVQQQRKVILDAAVNRTLEQEFSLDAELTRRSVCELYSAPQQRKPAKRQKTSQPTPVSQPTSSQPNATVNPSHVISEQEQQLQKEYEAGDRGFEADDGVTFPPHEAASSAASPNNPPQQDKDDREWHRLIPQFFFQQLAMYSRSEHKCFACAAREQTHKPADLHCDTCQTYFCLDCDSAAHSYIRNAPLHLKRVYDDLLGTFRFVRGTSSPLQLACPCTPCPSRLKDCDTRETKMRLYDQTGLHCVTVRYHTCMSLAHLLVRNGWWPATKSQPTVAFHSSFMQSCKVLNITCGASLHRIWQYRSQMFRHFGGPPYSPALNQDYKNLCDSYPYFLATELHNQHLQELLVPRTLQALCPICRSHPLIVEFDAIRGIKHLRCATGRRVLYRFTKNGIVADMEEYEQFAAKAEQALRSKPARSSKSADHDQKDQVCDFRRLTRILTDDKLRALTSVVTELRSSLSCYRHPRYRQTVSRHHRGAPCCVSPRFLSVCRAAKRWREV